jgi:hypothetical protein
MNKGDLINEVAKVVSTKKEAQDAVDCVFSSITKAMKTGDTVTLLFDICIFFPVAFFFQFFKLLVFLLILVKLCDTNRYQTSDNSIGSYFLSLTLGSTTRNPSTSGEADNHC